MTYAIILLDTQLAKMPMNQHSKEDSPHKCHITFSSLSTIIRLPMVKYHPYTFVKCPKTSAVFFLIMVFRWFYV